MTKLQVIDSSGSKKSEITTDIFDNLAREDLVQKIVEIEKNEEKQPVSPYMWAGMETSASGNVKHNRHVWKTDRGKGMSRFPKKRMSDKGDRFTWVGAVVPGTRKGRRAHPPKLERKILKINKKEKMIALKSALALTSSLEDVQKKYSSLNNLNLKINLPLIIDAKVIALKSGAFFDFMKKTLGTEVFEIAIQNKKVRAGIGKMRGRKYKRNAGMILIVGNNENKVISGIEVRKVKETKISDLWDNGTRLVMFTENAIKDFEAKLNGRKQEEVKK